MQNEYMNFLNGSSAENGRVKLAIADMEKSGLSPETLDTAGIKLFNDKSDILKKRLGFTSLNGNPILSVAVLMEIPYHDVEGHVLKHEYRLYPETDDKKYLHPLHSAPVPYIMSDVWAIRDKVNRPVWITEGVKKVLKLNQHGADCIGLSGVWGFRNGKGDGSLLCSELESFAWKGRSVYLAFDIDLWTNPSVRKALYELALHLIARGGLVYVCSWKTEKGIDDNLAAKKDPEKELAEIQEKAKQITSFILPEHRDDILHALSKTVSEMDELMKESIITSISKKLNIRPRSLYKVLLKDTVEQDPGFTEEQKEAAIKLLRSPTLIRLFLDICHTRYIGRDKTLLLIKLATMTRHLQRGLSVVLLGTSSVGKSALVETVLMTVDQQATENFSRTSAQYLLYRKDPLEHKIITFYEFNGADSSSAIIRTALTEGELHLGTVQKDASGSLTATEIRKETTGLVILSTYTGTKIDHELSTRVLLQEVAHDENLARAVYQQKAEAKPENSETFKIWQCADHLLEEKQVLIPYSTKLANIFPTHQERFHRDFDKTLTLIKASALLHQYQREQTEDGSILANRDDYELVYSLGDSFIQSVSQTSPQAVEIVKKAITIEGCTRDDLLKSFNHSERTLRRYLNQAREMGLVEFEGRGGNQKIKVVEIPEEITVLPKPDRLFQELDNWTTPDKRDCPINSVQIPDVTEDIPVLDNWTAGRIEKDKYDVELGDLT